MQNVEIIDIFDDDGNVVGTMPRFTAESSNHTTENVLVFIFNSLGNVLIQLRPKNKSHYPGLWDVSACGGITSDETTEEAAYRETAEETGISKLELMHVRTFLNIFPGDGGEERRRISSLYIGISDEEPKINDEVDEFNWWEQSELHEHASMHPELYIPSFIVELDIAINAYKTLQT